MKCSEGGIGLADIEEMFTNDFSDWLSAAEDVEKRIAAAVRK